MADRTIKAGDTDPPFTTTLTGPNGEPVNLTGAVSVRLYMAPKDGGLGIISDPCTITSPASGIVTYRPTPEETGTPGLYRMEWRVDWGTDAGKDRLQTFPNDRYEELEIMPNLTGTP